MEWNEYAVGTQVRMRVSFTDDDGNLVNPSNVTFTLTKPDGTDVNPSAVQESTGVYYADYLTDTRGWWLYRAVGSGSNPGASLPKQFSTV